MVTRYRVFIDGDKEHTPATVEEIVVGAKFKHGAIEYTVEEVDDGYATLKGMRGLASRSTIVEISQLTKPGSEYIIKRT